MVVEVTPLDGLPLPPSSPSFWWEKTGTRAGREVRVGGESCRGAFKGYYGGVEWCQSVVGGE